MNKEEKPKNDPSMEEILASIRRIISEDVNKESNSGSRKPEKFSGDDKELLGSTEFAYAEETLVDDLAREIMRPMIKEWLDNNLPQIVERVVSLEIERLSEIDKSNK